MLQGIGKPVPFFYSVHDSCYIYAMLFRPFVYFLLLILFLPFGCNMQMRINDDEAKKEFQKKGVLLSTQTVNIDNHKIHFAETGNKNGPVLIFIHGSPGSWDAFQNYLSDSLWVKKYHLISIDRPGFGYSDYGKAMSVVRQCEFIEQTIVSCGFNHPVFLIGHSLGGPVVIKVGADLKDKIAGIVVLAGSVSPELEEKENWRYIMDTPPLRYLLPGAFYQSNKEIKLFKKEVSFIAASVPDLLCPILVIQGDKDPLVNPGNAEYIYKHNPKHTSIIYIKGANHFIPWQHEKRLKRSIDTFVGNTLDKLL